MPKGCKQSEFVLEFDRKFSFEDQKLFDKTDKERFWDKFMPENCEKSNFFQLPAARNRHNNGIRTRKSSLESIILGFTIVVIL